jgi:hypothetical protein
MPKTARASALSGPGVDRLRLTGLLPDAPAVPPAEHAPEPPAPPPAAAPAGAPAPLPSSPASSAPAKSKRQLLREQLAAAEAGTGDA